METDVLIDSEVASHHVAGSSSLLETDADAQHDDKKSRTVKRRGYGKTRIWKQRAAIHTLMKKARAFAVRRLLRRIKSLRERKGDESELAKNDRKVARHLSEIEALKGLIIDDVTERIADVLLGNGKAIDAEIWAACSSSASAEKLIQQFSCSSLEADPDKFEKLAYIRMWSQEIICAKLKLVEDGTNIRPKEFKPRGKQSTSKNIKNAKNRLYSKAGQGNKHSAGKPMKKERRPVAKQKEVPTSPVNQKNEVKSDVNRACDNRIQLEGADTLQLSAKHVPPKQKSHSSTGPIANVTSKPATKSKTDRASNLEPVQRVSSKPKLDSFFMSSMKGRDSDSGTDDEFSAPVDRKKPEMVVSQLRKRNRMGQRQRKLLLERESQRSNNRNGDRKLPKSSSSVHSRRQPSSVMKHKTPAHIPTTPKKLKTPPYKSSSSYKSQTSKHKAEQNPERTKPEPAKPAVRKALHPSWVAKQQVKAKQGLQVFAGTKITFDD